MWVSSFYINPPKERNFKEKTGYSKKDFSNCMPKSIVIDTHPLNNPWLNYSVYLCNTFAPGVLMLLIFIGLFHRCGNKRPYRTRMASQGDGCTDDRYIAYPASGTEFCILMGSAFILYVRAVIPCDGNASGSARISQSVPAASLFPDLCNQALNGYPMIYSWINYVALLIFMMLPFFVVHRLKEALISKQYVP